MKDAAKIRIPIRLKIRPVAATGLKTPFMKGKSPKTTPNIASINPYQMNIAESKAPIIPNISDAIARSSIYIPIIRIFLKIEMWSLKKIKVLYGILFVGIPQTDRPYRPTFLPHMPYQ